MQANPPVHRCRPLLEITQRPLAEVLTASGPQYLQRGSFIMFQLCSVGCTGATDFVGAQLPWRGERLHTTCAAPMQLKLMLLFKQCTDTCNCLPIPLPRTIKHLCPQPLPKTTGHPWRSREDGGVVLEQQAGDGVAAVDHRGHVGLDLPEGGEG